MIEAMLDVRARLPRKGLPGERFAHRLAEDPQAVQLVVRFEEVDALASVRGQMHRRRPVLAGGSVAVDGDEAVRGEDGVPQGVLFGIVWRAVLRVPPDGLVDGGDFFAFG